VDKTFLIENGHTLLLWTRKKTLTAALAAVVASDVTIKEVENFFMGVDIKNEYFEFNLLPEDERKCLSAFVKAKYNALHYIARKTEKN
jgi:hypothetical protein